jgi:cation diffusion facilitator CzcD-associated flavoprotein CzcO
MHHSTEHRNFNMRNWHCLSLQVDVAIIGAGLAGLATVSSWCRSGMLGTQSAAAVQQWQGVW